MSTDEPPKEGMSSARAWAFVPVLYFLEGLPYVIVNVVSVLMFKKLEVPNSEIGLWTSLIAFPWTLKMLWGPAVEVNWTKRGWIIATQALLVLGLVAAAWTIGRPDFLAATLVVLAMMAFVSATHDIAADGFYLLALNEKAQAFFVGVRSTFYRLAMIFGSGLLVWFAGSIEEIQETWEPSITGPMPPELNPFSRFLVMLDSGASGFVENPIARSWSLALLFGAFVYGLGLLLNSVVLPRPAADAPRSKAGEPAPPWSAAFAAFFRQSRFGWILAFILFYRLGESMIGKMSGPFLLDETTKGGLGVPTADVGIISGTIGVLALTIGGILGGVVIARWGIRRCLWPMALCLNIPNLFYVWASTTKPDIQAVTALIAVDQFGYGFGFTAYMVYLMYVSQGTRFETASYAIATGLMALGAMGAGIASRYLQEWLGYAGFFVAVCFLALPGMATLFFIPLDRGDLFEAKVDIN